MQGAKKFSTSTSLTTLGIDSSFPERYATFHNTYLNSKDPRYLIAGLSQLKRDVVLFVEMCIKVSSRGLGGRKKTMCFEMWGTQKELLRKMHRAYLSPDAGGVVCEKARQQGASWLVCAFALFIAFFNQKEEIGFTSMKEDLVHKLNNVSSLLGKIEFMIANLPTALSQQLTFCSINKKNIDINGSTIMGFTGEEGPRSATPDVLINDEFAFNPYAGSILTGAVPATHTSIFISTLNRPDDEFDRLRKTGAYTKHVLDWRDDPRVTDYDAFRKKRIQEFNGDERRFEREFERKYDTSTIDYLFPPDWMEALRAYRAPPGTERGPIVAGLDIAGSGSNSNVLLIRQGGIILGCYKWQTSYAHETVELVIEHCTQHNVATLSFDEIGVGYGIASEFNRRLGQQRLPFSTYGVAFSWSADRQITGARLDVVLAEKEKSLYFNMRAKLYWKLREKVRATAEKRYAEGIEIRESAILDQMGRLTFSVESGKIKLISKVALRTKAQKAQTVWVSPDELDALVLSFAMDEGMDYVNLCEKVYA